MFPLQARCGSEGGRGALLLHDRGTRRGWVVSSMPRPHFIPGKDPVPIVQEVGWAPRPVWTGGKSRLHRDSIPDRPARSQSLYRLSYRAHKLGSTGPTIALRCFQKLPYLGMRTNKKKKCYCGLLKTWNTSIKNNKQKTGRMWRLQTARICR